MISPLNLTTFGTSDRFLQAVPGIAIWMLLLSPLWLGILSPHLMAVVMMFFIFYWLSKSLATTIGNFIGTTRMRIDVKQDWLQKCCALGNEGGIARQLPKHLILIAQRTPNYQVLKSSIQSLYSQNYPLDLIYLSVSFEAKELRMPTVEIETLLKADFPRLADRMNFFVHPHNLPGEVPGAAANRTWAAKQSVKILLERGENIEEFLVTAPDEDIVFHRQYFAAISYKYLSVPNADKKFYHTAVYNFHNNYWKVPTLIRNLSADLSLMVMANNVVERVNRETWSVYTLNLKLLHNIGYWDTSHAVDDTIFYWRAFFYLKGNWECEVIYIPLSADAIFHPGYVENHKQQYKQYVRWGWGVLAFPIAAKGLMTSKDIPLPKRLLKFWNLFEVYVMWKVLSFMLAAAIPLLSASQATQAAASMSYTLIQLSTLLLIPNIIFKAVTAPGPSTISHRVLSIMRFTLETPLSLVANAFLFNSVPFIEATTRFMLGQDENASITWSAKFKGI